MSSALSNDLRRRVVDSIEGGLSRRAAARRFGVSASSAIRWHQLYLKSGNVAPAPMGGDRRSGAIEAHAGTILGWVDEEVDLTLDEMAERLAALGYPFAPSTVWRFLDRHQMTHKKRPHMPVSRSAKT